MKPLERIANPRILLIFPPLTVLPTDYPTPDPPLGLAYIAAVLEKHGFDVRILDAFAQGLDNVELRSGSFIRIGMSEHSTKKYLREFTPDLVGISCAYTAHAGDAFDIARLVKETLPKAVVAVGGAHATSSARQVLTDPNIDLVVMGEGEETVLELATCLKNGEDISAVKGITTRVDGQIVETPRRPYIQNLDALPFPAWHLLPMQIYLEVQEATRSYSMRPPRMNIITSRGCPGNCVFCSIHSVWGHRWRSRSPENVVAEMEFLVQQYGVREFYVLDDNLTLNPKRVIKICDLMIKKGLDVKWATPNGVAIWTINEELLVKMKESGYYRITFGIESGNEEILKIIGKPVDLGKAREVIKLCNRIGLWTHSTFIIGFPAEKKESIMKTIDFAKKSWLDFASFYVATPYPGTELHRIYREYNLVSDDDKLQYGSQYNSITKAGYNTLYLTREELDELRNKAYQEFLYYKLARLFINPLTSIRYLWPKIRSLEDLRYFARLMSNVMAVYFGRWKTGEIRTHQKRRI